MRQGWSTKWSPSLGHRLWYGGLKDVRDIYLGNMCVMSEQSDEWRFIWADVNIPRMSRCRLYAGSWPSLARFFDGRTNVQPEQYSQNTSVNRTQINLSMTINTHHKFLIPNPGLPTPYSKNWVALALNVKRLHRPAPRWRKRTVGTP